MARQLAEALAVPFTSNSLSAGATESHLFGRVLPGKDGSAEYKPAPLVRTCQNGGLHLFDEMDAADANMLISVNMILANRRVSIPFADIELALHEKTYLVCAMNTWGAGATAEYVGRSPLDAATLDRFALTRVFVDYDRELERDIAEQFAIAGADDLLRWAWITREKIHACKLRKILSTRTIANAARLVAAGFELAEVQRQYFAGWSDAEKARIN
jgi:MoxR-like ATPase